MNNPFIDNAKDLDIVMLMGNLSEYIENYSMTSGSLRNYERGETNDDEKEIGNVSYRTNNNMPIAIKC